MGSAGAFALIQSSITQHRNSFSYALGNNNFFGCIVSIRAMGSVLPQEAKYKVPDPPELVFKQVRAQPDEIELRRWIDIQINRVEKAISDYTYYFYKNNQSSL